jgi:hypothetical protein
MSACPCRCQCHRIPRRSHEATTQRRQFIANDYAAFSTGLVRSLVRAKVNGDVFEQTSADHERANRSLDGAIERQRLAGSLLCQCSMQQVDNLKAAGDTRGVQRHGAQRSAAPRIARLAGRTRTKSCTTRPRRTPHPRCVLGGGGASATLPGHHLPATSTHRQVMPTAHAVVGCDGLSFDARRGP